MYVEQSTGANVIKAITQGVNLAAQNLDYADTLMKEKAKSDMFYAQAQLNADAQNFLRGLEQKNDYENFGKYTEDFMSKQKSALQKQAKNHYTAQLYDQMLTQARDSLYNTVAAKTMQMEYMHIGTQNASAIQLNNENYSGQAGIDANNSIYNSEYANGYRNEAYTKAALLTNARDNATKEVFTNATSVMDAAIKNGGSFADIQSYIDNFLNEKEYSVKMLTPGYASTEGMQIASETGEGYIDIGNELDKNVIKESVTQKLQQQWKLKLEALDEKNMEAVTQGYVKMIEMPEEDRPSYAAYWLRKIDTDMSGHNLTAAHRKQATDMYNLFAKGTAASGKGKDWEKALEDTFKQKSEYYINLFRNGEISAYHAETTLKNVMLNEFTKLTGSENIDEMRQACPGVERFLDNLYKEAPDKMKGAIKDLKGKFTEIAKNLKLEGIEELEAEFTDLSYDCLSVMKLSDEQAFQDALDQLYTDLNAFEGKKLDIVRKNPETGKLRLEKGVFNNPLYDYLSEIEKQNNLVYSDRHGDIKPSVFATGGEGLERGATLEAEKLSRELGIDEESFGKRFAMSYENDDPDKDDVKATHVFTERSTGKQYKLMADTGSKKVKMYTKNPSGKWTEYKTTEERNEIKKENDRKAIMEKALSAAENLDQKKLTEAGITNVEWLKNASNKKWLANAISDMVGRYNQSKNALEKTKIKKQLEALGYSL